MHVCMLTGEYPPRWGGMGSTVYSLSSALSSLGHRVSVITRKSSGSPPLLDGVRVIQVPWLPIPMEFTRSFGRHSLKALEKLHSEDPVDVVHLHCPMISWDERQLERCKDRIAPIVSSMHGTWLGEREGLLTAARLGEPAVWANPNDIAIRYLAGRYSKFETHAIRHSAVVVPNSIATRDELVGRYDAPDDWDCEVIHWGVDTTTFAPLHRDSEDAIHNCNKIRSKYCANDGTVLLLAVGRLAARKGHGQLIRSLQRVNSSGKKAHLVIVGRGRLKRKLQRLAYRLGEGERVFIEPSLPFSDLAELYRCCDLTVFPSVYEGQGLIPLESMASGTPVVTVDHGPLPEMVDSSVGSLFEVGNVESMASAILQEISSKENLSSKGMEGRRLVLDRFTLEGNAKSFLEVYQRAIAREG